MLEELEKNAFEDTWKKQTYIKEYSCAVVTKELSDFLEHSHRFLAVLLLALQGM